MHQVLSLRENQNHNALQRAFATPSLKTDPKEHQWLNCKLECKLNIPTANEENDVFWSKFSTGQFLEKGQPKITKKGIQIGDMLWNWAEKIRKQTFVPEWLLKNEPKRSALGLFQPTVAPQSMDAARVGRRKSDTPPAGALFSRTIRREGGLVLSVPDERPGKRKKSKASPSEGPCDNSNCGVILAENIRNIKVLVHDGHQRTVWLTLAEGSTDTVRSIQKLLCSRLT
jgi:hypothetical protein